MEELMVVNSKRVIKPNDDPDPAPRAGCWLGTVSAEPGAGICHMLIPHLMPSYAMLCYAVCMFCKYATTLYFYC